MPRHNIFARIATGLLLAQSAGAYVTDEEIADGANPDASGKVQFYAPKFDTDFPGSWGNITQNPWTLKLNLTRNSTAEVGKESDRAPVFTIQAKPPAPGLAGSPYLSNGSWALDYNATRSWAVMMGVLDFSKMHQVPEANDKELGSCPEKVYTKDCVAAIKDAAKNPSDDRGVYNITDLPACKDQAIPRSIYNVQLDSMIQDGEYFENGMTFRLPSRALKNSLENYDKQGLFTFPVFIFFRDGRRYLGNRPPLTDEHIVIACVKVDTAHNGAVLPTGGSARAAIAQVWVGVGMALGTGLLLLT